MTTKVKKLKPEPSKALVRLSSNLPYAHRLAHDLNEMARSVPEEATFDLGMAMLALKPVGKALDELESTVKKELVARAHPPEGKGKALVKLGPWQNVDKHRRLEYDGGTVTVQTRERMVEKEGAVEWLYKHNRAVYISSVEERILIRDEEVFRTAFDLLRSSMEQSTLKQAVGLMMKAVERARTLNQKSVEKAVLDGTLPQKDIEHLYAIDTTYAVVVGAPSDAKGGHG